MQINSLTFWPASMWSICDLQVSSFYMIFNLVHKLFTHSTLKAHLNWLQAWLGVLIGWLLVFWLLNEKCFCKHWTFCLVDMCQGSEQWLPVCGAPRAESASPRKFAEVNFWGPTPNLLNQELGVESRDWSCLYQSSGIFPAC